MIARRLSLPRMRSPDCGYSSTKSSASNRSCASTSFVIIACVNCSTVARLSFAIALSSPGRCHAGAPVRGGAAGERCGVLGDLPRRAPLGPQTDRAPIRRDRALLRRAVHRGVRELVEERALHVEALAPRHLFVAQ